MKMSTQLPDALVNRLRAQFGLEANGILKAFKVKRPMTLRVNTLKTTDRDVMDVARRGGIQLERVMGVPHAFAVKNRSEKELLAHTLCTDGWVYLQGVASMIPPLVADVRSGQAVLDLCAAPGSKTSQMAAMMQNTGCLVAVEKDEVRLQKLQNTLRVQGASMVSVVRADASLPMHEWDGVFDVVLADVPCSAEGRMDLSDKRSMAFWSQKNIIAHAKTQRRLLRSAVRALKPGGHLVYSTCTLAPEENEFMMAWVLSEFAFLKAEPLTVPLQAQHAARPSGIYILPTSRHEGLFVARLKKLAIE